MNSLRLLTTWIQRFRWICRVPAALLNRFLDPPSDRIHLVREQLCWREAQRVFSIGRELRALGFRPVGEFRVHELPDVRLGGLIHAAGFASAVYELGGSGVHVEFIAQLADGKRLAVSNARDRDGRPRRALEEAHFLPEASVERLWESFRSLVGSRDTRVIERSLFPRWIEVDWSIDPASRDEASPD